MIKKFENMVYDADYVEEVNKISSSIKSLKCYNNNNFKLYCCEVSVDEYDDEYYISNMIDNYDLLESVDRFIRTDKYEDIINNESFIYAFAIGMDLKDRKYIEQPMLVSYLHDMFGDDGESCDSIGSSSFEKYINIMELISSLEKLGYYIYSRHKYYFIVKKPTK